MAAQFWKYHGAGNDFVLLDKSRGAPTLSPARVRAICERRTGVGADGVLEIGGDPGSFSMVVHNADGSLAEMCGNGLRCTARYLRDHRGAPSTGLDVQTGAGRLRCWYVGLQVSVEMGPTDDLGACTIDLGGERLAGRRLSTGNPHLVLFGAWSRTDVERLGPQLQVHPTFPAGVNVSFAQVLGPRRVRLQVWERGSGLTQACGTAAVATTAAASFEGRVKLDGEVAVELPGGHLHVAGDPTTLLTLRGPAVEVFQGTLEP